MNIEKFIDQKEFENVNKRLQNIRNEIQLNSFNLFTISSYNSYLENFHSDVIAILLNPNERHNQKNSFLNLFLDYLIEFGVKINKDDYAFCEITREQGRIDIWIKDNTSKKSIIIENKINNAGDQENQLENYYNYAKNSGFEIDSIVYLTLNGNKNAPLTDVAELNEKIQNMSAFKNNITDLSNGWLKKCYENSENEDNRSFIFQYLKLIKHLSQVGMDRQIKEDFYSVINKEDGFLKTKAIAELVAGLEEYRADLFAAKIGNDYLPFRKTYRWRPNHWLYENFNENGVNFKLDVYFNNDGSARIDFWNPNQPEETQKTNTSTKLKSIGLFEKFEFGGFGGGMCKIFNLESFENIEALDNEIYNSVRELFEKLRT
ncbi:PD-(D/E)XK nuclease superfamily protein [Flavobacterium succinicans]|uniref:PD-(D/E)XK nuclease superfamily protein n=1 Tax=Flavobacterium succinicans TaxID=29536 RepID=A0A1I5A6V3_9FLAO|nr:PD-(D/E)XK nuclease family protein [Flavobacterium succinicans]SFN58183.1 PD-(D/E)XK nuclease superfamily protein [Flavobacterium succinicans]